MSVLGELLVRLSANTAGAAKSGWNLGWNLGRNMAENMAEKKGEKVIISPEEFVKTIITKVGMFDAELRYIVTNHSKAFAGTALELTRDREEILALKSRVEALERQAFGLPPKE